MKIEYEKLQCGKCIEGTVIVTIKETKKICEVSVKNCDKCKAFYGLKGIQNLETKYESNIS